MKGKGVERFVRDGVEWVRIRGYHYTRKEKAEAIRRDGFHTKYNGCAWGYGVYFALPDARKTRACYAYPEEYEIEVEVEAPASEVHWASMATHEPWDRDGDAFNAPIVHVDRKQEQEQYDCSGQVRAPAERVRVLSMHQLPGLLEHEDSEDWEMRVFGTSHLSRR